MYKQKLALSTCGGFGISEEEQIKLFAKTGFEGFFTGYDSDEQIKKCRKLADEIGMIYQSVHAPYTKMNKMWYGLEEGKAAREEHIRCVHACSENAVPIMITHVFIGFTEHSPNEIGVENFGMVVDEAEKCGVKIAFENTEGEEYLDCIMSAFKDKKNVGFCWDSGHEMCYNRHRDLLADYGDRLLGTHLNDNLGIKDYSGNITWIDDLHLLPFDGIADWKYNMDRLNKCGWDDILTFELTTKSKPDRHENDKYGAMPIEVYVAEAYSRACRLAAMKKY